MSFKDIKGQKRAIEFFRSSVNRDKLAHAYLFVGPQGLGKTLLARNLAKFLNCENPVKDKDLIVDCCDSCSSCRKIEDLNHPDVHWIEAEQAKKISIEQMRLAQREIALKAFAANIKIFIILEAQNMTEEAANSLLKTLEEPPGSSLIILTSTDISGLLPTIISRCQIIKFYPLKLERLKGILTVDYKLHCANVHFLSAQAEGRIGRALSLKDQDTLDKKNSLINRVCQSDRQDSSVDIFDIKDKKELTNQIRYLLNWFRDILIMKSGLSESNIINADRLTGIKSQTSFFSFQDLEQIIDKIDQTHRLIEQNVNPKIALEVMLRDLKKCRK